MHKIFFLRLLQFIVGSEYVIPKMTVVEFIKLINKNLNADSRYILFVFNRQNYGIKFTDFKYGASEESLLIREALEKGEKLGYDLRSDSDEEKPPMNVRETQC